MKSERSFRRCVVGGFNPQDVVSYISRKNREYREEIEALRSGADKLRRERDSLLAGQPITGSLSSAIEAEVPAPAVLAESLTAEKNNSAMDELRIQFYEMRKERDTLRSKLDALTDTQDIDREVMERFSREKAAFEADRASLLASFTRREAEKEELANERAAWGAEKAALFEERQQLLLQVERAGASRERRKREEEEAARLLEGLKAQAATVRQETAKLIAESRAMFDDMNEKSYAAALEVVLELDRMRDFFARLPERFADTGQLLSKLESDPRPFMREFTPKVFEASEEKGVAGVPASIE